MKPAGRRPRVTFAESIPSLSQHLRVSEINTLPFPA